MAEKDQSAFVARYIAVDSHLNERNGSTKQVLGIAGERPAGRKLADDIAKHCNQLDADGYEVISIFPLTGGRAAEVSAEAAEEVTGRTYRASLSDDDDDEESDYVDTGVGYSVTDGVIVVANRRRRRSLRD